MENNNGPLGFLEGRSITLISMAILYWILAFMFTGFYVQSEFFDIEIVSESQLENFEGWLSSFEDDEFGLLDIGAFIGITTISFLGFPWYINIIVNVIPAFLLLLGLIALARGV